MTPEEKQALADEAEKAVQHPLVRGAMEEFARNMRFRFAELPEIGLTKVAHYAAVIARCEALGIDPEEMRRTPEEQEAEILRRARLMVAEGKPALRLGDDGATRLD